MARRSNTDEPEPIPASMARILGRKKTKELGFVSEANVRYRLRRSWANGGFFGIHADRPTFEVIGFLVAAWLVLTGLVVAHEHSDAIFGWLDGSSGTYEAPTPAWSALQDELDLQGRSLEWSLFGPDGTVGPPPDYAPKAPG